MSYARSPIGDLSITIGIKFISGCVNSYTRLLYLNPPCYPEEPKDYYSPSVILGPPYSSFRPTSRNPSSLSPFHFPFPPVILNVVKNLGRRGDRSARSFAVPAYRQAGPG